MEAIRRKIKSVTNGIVIVFFAFYRRDTRVAGKVGHRNHCYHLIPNGSFHSPSTLLLHPQHPKWDSIRCHLSLSPLQSKHNALFDKVEPSRTYGVRRAFLC